MYVHSYKMDAIVKHCKRPKVVSLKIINGNIYIYIYIFFFEKINGKN